MSPGTLSERQHEKAAQKVREARQHIADIPKSERSLGDYFGLFVLGVVEEALSHYGDDE